MKIFGYNINFNKVQNAAPVHQDKPLPEKAIITKKISYQNTLARTKQDIATWRSALQSAESLQYPNRAELYRLYKDVVLDAHLTSLIETRKNAILSSNFIVTKKDKEKTDKTEFIKKKWFYDFVNLALDSKFYGYSLIQFGEFKNDEFSDLTLVPREYVKPEFSIVVPTPYQQTGENYLESPYKEWLIGVGEKTDLGLLAKAAPLVLWKKGALQAWAEYTEVFGVPMRIGKTNTRDEATRGNMEAMLRDMGNSAWGVFDTDEVVELIETNKNSASEIFEKLIEKCDEQLSKLILGQTSTADQKSFVGSANVHERILHQINEADEIFMENIFTYQLVPFLNMHNLGFNGLKIESEADDELNLEQKSIIDLKLLEFYDIPPEYILETYGTPVIAKAISASTASVESKPVNIQNKLSEYYGDTEL